MQVDVRCQPFAPQIRAAVPSKRNPGRLPPLRRSIDSDDELTGVEQVISAVWDTFRWLVVPDDGEEGLASRVQGLVGRMAHGNGHGGRSPVTDGLYDSDEQ